MKHIKQRMGAVLASVVLTISASGVAYAAAPYQATNLLGQYTAGTPDYSAVALNGSGGPGANSGGLNRPNAMALDSVGHRLFIADALNNRVIVHDLDASNQIVDETADAVLGQADFVSATAATTQSGMNNPHGVAFDVDTEYLYVADSNNYRVLVFDVATITNGEAAIHVIGQPDFVSSTDGLSQTQFSYPEEVVIDSANNRLFVADFTNSRVMVFDVSAVSNGMSAQFVIGQPDFTTFNIGTSASMFFYVDAIAYDSTTDRLFVADGFNDRVLVFDVAVITNGMSASNVLGAADMTSAGSSSASSSTVSFSRGLAVDEDNQLLFAKDTSGSRVMIFDIASITNNELAIAVLGQANFTDSYVTPYGQSYIGYDGGLLYDSLSSGLFVSDYDEHRVSYFSLVQLTTAALNTAIKDQAFSQQLGKTGDQGATTFSLAAGSLPIGVSLSPSGLLSGTPTESGSFNITVRLEDDNGTAGTIHDTRSYVLTVNAPSADSDGDGISDDLEAAGPNGGDANGDSIQDATQANVGSTTNVVTAKSTTVALSGGTLSNYVTQDEGSLPTQNPDVDFPVGLNSFEATGLALGATVTVEVYYDQAYDTSAWSFMKYNASDDTYTDISSIVTYSTATIGGADVTKATYELTDGGPNDEDGVANGTIVDPAGPATQVLAATGEHILQTSVFGFVAVVFAGTLFYTSRRSNLFSQF